MRRRTTVSIAALLLLVLSLSGALEAQIIYGEKKSVSGRLTYQSWKLSTGSGRDTTLTQAVFPVSFFFPFAPHWEIHLSSAASYSSLDDGGVSADVSSLTLSTLRLFRSFAGDRIFAAAGITLPTGKTKLDTLQAGIAQLISDDYLNLPVKQLGGGAGFLLQVGGAAQYEWLLYGGSVAYNYTGSYKYLKDGDDYNPGDEITLQASGNAIAGDGSFDLDLAYKYYTADKIKTREIFRSGGVFSAILSGRYTFTKTAVTLSVAEIIRNKNSLQFGGSIRAEEENSHGNKTVVNGSVAYLLPSGLSLSALAEYRQLSANGYDVASALHFGKCDLLSFGGGVQYSGFDDMYALYARVLFSNGEANKNSLSSNPISISGAELTAGGRVRF